MSAREEREKHRMGGLPAAAYSVLRSRLVLPVSVLCSVFALSLDDRRFPCLAPLSARVGSRSVAAIKTYAHTYRGLITYITV